MIKRFLMCLPWVIVACMSCDAPQKSPINKPNIVFILADDLGWADLPIYGNTFNEAPNITKLADEGMRFDNAYAASPVCSPTRASIQSGQYPATVGITDFITGHWRPYEEVIVPTNSTQYLPLENIIFAERLKEAGYATGYVGKWHLGGGEFNPTRQGYDEQAVYNGGSYFEFGNRMSPPQQFADSVVLSEALTDLGLDFIEKNKKKPFLLFLSHYDVHVQLDAQQELIDKYMNKPKADGYPSNAVYAAMVENIDRSVGRVTARLKELGLEDNTILVFFSDNGGLVSRFDKVPLIADSKQYLYEGDTLLYVASSNGPLRGEKGTLYEGGIREPFLVKWPGVVAAGALNHSLVSSVDFYPTFLDLAGLSNDGRQQLDGNSLMPVLTRQVENYDRTIFWHYPVYHHHVPASALRKGDFKLIENLVDGSLELYNLREDVGEKQDLSDSLTEKTEELYEILKNWQKETGAKIPVPNPDFDAKRRHEWGIHPDRQQ
ncbi:MAG: sulfatase [Cyclobacteriaceae bacterium]|nr:sulfatase [Cyclobacteriaceae bacterium]